MRKQVNFGIMMRRQLNEVISNSGNYFRLQIKILDSQCFIMKPLNQKYVPFIEKVNTLFQTAESQHFIYEMLAFFFSPYVKSRTTVTQ